MSTDREHPLDVLPDGVALCDDGRTRCSWVGNIPGFAPYHDVEWGFPVADEHHLFEKICLEGFQSGLSWRTILDKRDAFREVFLGFDFEKVARFDASDVERLLRDARIVRHRGKIEATIHNAGRACEAVEAHGSLGALIWAYEPEPIVRAPSDPYIPPGKTQASARFAADLKRLGWRFFGPTTAYAFMQAMGLVNDHHPSCAVWQACESARDAFVRPQNRCLSDESKTVGARRSES